MSATYERRANRLFGDKFPKVSRIDLATIPIPRMSKVLATRVGKTAFALQRQWEEFRFDLENASSLLTPIDRSASLADFAEFWNMTEQDFIGAASHRYGISTQSNVLLLRRCYAAFVKSVNSRWHQIVSSEEELETLVKRAFGVNEEIYELVTRSTPNPSISWALFAMRG